MRSGHNPTVCVGSYYFQQDRKEQSEKHSRPQAGMGREGVGWRTGHWAWGVGIPDLQSGGRRGRGRLGAPVLEPGLEGSCSLSSQG